MEVAPAAPISARRGAAPRYRRDPQTLWSGVRSTVCRNPRGLRGMRHEGLLNAESFGWYRQCCAQLSDRWQSGMGREILRLLRLSKVAPFVPIATAHRRRLRLGPRAMTPSTLIPATVIRAPGSLAAPRARMGRTTSRIALSKKHLVPNKIGRLAPQRRRRRARPSPHRRQRSQLPRPRRAQEREARRRRRAILDPWEPPRRLYWRATQTTKHLTPAHHLTSRQRPSPRRRPHLPGPITRQRGVAIWNYAAYVFPAPC
jgi:hypothetical protein